VAYDPVLGNRFLFEREALEANGEGRLSEEQERLLDATVRVMRRREPRVKAMLVIVFAAVIALVVIAIAATPGGGLASGIVAGVILAWILGLIAFFRARGRRTREAMEMRRLLTAEGPLRIVSDSTQVWWANVGQARFSVDVHQADVLTEGERYRVHYIQLPDGAMPLSLESADPS
jgi:hypothetical protein